MHLKVKSSSYTSVGTEWLGFHFKHNFFRIKSMSDEDIDNMFKKLDRGDKKILCAYMETIANFYSQYK